MKRTTIQKSLYVISPLVLVICFSVGPLSSKFLLDKEESELAAEGLIRVNFDPVLVRLLREVKYL